MRGLPIKAFWLVPIIAVLGTFVVLLGGSASPVHAEEPDLTAYRQAAAYCRGDVPRPMALSADKQILCFDGLLKSRQDYPPLLKVSKTVVFSWFGVPVTI